MFSRAVRPAVAVARNAQQQQGMATLREIEQRLKSVKNIEKITKVGFSGPERCTLVQRFF